MIHDQTRLREVIEELADLPLAVRRAHIADISKVQGEASAEQLREGLKRHWERK